MTLDLPAVLPVLSTATGRFILVPYEPSHAELLADVLGHAEVWAQGYGDGEPLPAGRDELLSFIERRYVGLPVFSIFTSGLDPRFVGTTGLTDSQADTERVKIGRTVVAPEFWGSMVNHEVKLALLGWLFDCGAGRIEADVDPRNSRSITSLCRFGFTVEGTRRRSSQRFDGTWRDIVILSLLREEWVDVAERAQTTLAGWTSPVAA
ncbi:GNAT family N-acetyltransferase [Arthrobacter sp. A2-55]|uniref:GNAT family N-acetyltransferase n=1 Tax=Arthrobacter sp. A2-55 TaxID=2897337 RepID=UPI0021CD85BF|nr:GNAT family protein [Arthrobacter sp. A2-55]MCU6480541.1 GNAT family N-acetyltransferase [Arthrobacter sp. A2-55]